MLILENNQHLHRSAKLALSMLALTLVLPISTGCSSKLSSNGIDGFNGNVSLDTTKEDLLNNSPFKSSNGEDEKDQIIFNNVEFADKYNGDLYYVLRDDNTIDHIIFEGSVATSKEMNTYLSDIEKLYGEPLHTENYNDRTKKEAHYLYRSNDINIILKINTKVLSDFSLTYQYPSKDDSAYLDNNKTLEENRKSNKTGQSAYDTLFNIAKYNGKPLSEACDDLGLKYYGSQSDEYTNIDKNIFYRKVDFLDCEAYEVYSDYEWSSKKYTSEDYPGMISYPYLAVVEPDDEQLFRNNLEKYIGKITETQNSSSITKEEITNTPLEITIGSTHFNKERCIYIQPEISQTYYLIDPSFESTNDLEDIEPYDVEEQLDSLIELLTTCRSSLLSTQETDNNDSSSNSIDSDNSEQSTTTTQEKFIATGNQALMPFITSSDHTGYIIDEPSRDGNWVTAKIKKVGDTDYISNIYIRYYTENQKVYCVDVIADSEATLLSDEYLNALVGMTMSINPNVSETDARNDSSEAIGSDSPIVRNDMQFLRENNCITVSY